MMGVMEQKENQSIEHHEKSCPQVACDPLGSQQTEQPCYGLDSYTQLCQVLSAVAPLCIVSQDYDILVVNDTLCAFHEKAIQR